MTQPTRSSHSLTSSRLLARNAAWNLVTQCIPMVVALGTMPWIIRGLGTDRFGIMTLSWMVLGYFSLFDLGLGRALTKLVAEMLGRGENERIPGLVWTAMLLMTGLGLLGTVFVAAVTPRLVDMLEVAPELQFESRGAFYMMAAALPFLIGTAGLRGVMEAHQRFGAINFIRTCTSLFLQIAPLAVLPFSRSLIAVVGVVAFGRLASWIAHVFVLLTSLPGLRSRVEIRRDLMGSLMSFGGWMTAVNIINPLMVQMDRFLIAGLLSATAVTFYTTPYELITKTWFLSNAVLGVMFPAFATSYVVDRGHTAEILSRCYKHVGLILFPLVLAAVGLGAEILRLWVGADFAMASTRVLQWLALGVLLNGLGQVPSAMIQGIGRPDLTFKIHAAELPPYLLAAWWLITHWGIEGAAIAWTGRCALDLGLYLLVSRAVLPECDSVIRGLLKTVALSASVLLLASLPLGLGYRLTVVTLGVLLFACFAWLRLLDLDERETVLSVFRSLPQRLAHPPRSSVVTDSR